MMHSTRKPPGRQDSAKQGSALLTSVIFSTVILFGLAGLMPMLLSDWKMTSRTSLQEAAFTLAESAVDEAIWAAMEYGDDEGDWTAAGWAEDADGKYWYREWNLAEISRETGINLNLDERRNGVYRALVEKMNASQINIIAQGIVSGGANVHGDTQISRYIEAEFRRPNPFVGAVARGLFTVNGGTLLNSFDSRLFPFIFSIGDNSGSEVFAGTISDDLDDLNLGNSTVEGDIGTGSEDPEDGTDPAGRATVTGDVEWEFEMEFPEVTVPNTSGWATSI